MYYQYNSSELADDDRWTTACSETEQQRVNQKSDWQTVKEKYSGAEWSITTPISRGQVIAGPTQFPNNLLPFPKIITNNLGLDQASSVQVTVNKPNGEPQHNARVALYTTSQPEAAYIGQGLTVKGEITVYGAAPGDTIQAGTLDGALSGKVTINDTNKPYILTLESQAAFSPQAADLPPYLILTPGQTGQQNDLDLWVFDLAPTDGPFTAIVTPVGGQALPPKELEYSDSDQIHLISFSLPGNQLGTGRIQINDPNGVPILSSDYSLQPAEATAVNTIYSADGNFTLHTPADSLGFGANGLVTVATSGNVPNVPEGVQLVGNAYDLGLSEIGPLAKQSSIKLYYHPAVMGHYEELAIYYWLAPEKQWQAIGGTLNPIDFGVTIADNRQGIYALMGKPTTQPPSLDKLIFLPTLLKNSYRLLSSRH